MTDFRDDPGFQYRLREGQKLLDGAKQVIPPTNPPQANPTEHRAATEHKAHSPSAANENAPSALDRVNLDEINIKITNLVEKLRGPEEKTITRSVMNSSKKKLERSPRAIAFGGGYTPEEVYWTSRVEAEADFLCDYLQGVMQIYDGYFGRLGIKLSSGELAEVWAKGIEPRWKAMLQSLEDRFNGDYLGEQPCLLQGQIRELEKRAARILKGAINDWREKVAEAVSAERFGQLNPEMASLEKSGRGQLAGFAEGAMGDFWSDLEARFQALHDEQLQDKGHDGLHALWSAKPFDSADGSHWYLGGGTDRRRKLFEWLAERAVVQLEHSGGPNAVFFWLDLLKAESPHFQPIDSSSVVKGKQRRWKSGRIEFVCKASGEYCIKCATQQIIGKPAPQRNADIAKRRVIVKQNLTLEAWGVCVLFDEHHVPLPKTIEADDWRRAYRAPAYRHRIDSLIYRDRKS